MRLSSATIFYACFQTSVIAIADNLPRHAAPVGAPRRVMAWPDMPNVVPSCAEQTWPDLSSDCLQISVSNLAVKIRFVGM